MANNPNVNKVIYGNQTVMDITDTTAEPQSVLSGEVFYDRSGTRQTGTAIGGIPEEELRDTVGWTGKNLLNSVLESGTSGGITVDVNSDGSFHVYGTASASGGATFYLNPDLRLYAGDYIFSCEYTGTTDGSSPMLTQSLLASDGTQKTLDFAIVRATSPVNTGTVEGTDYVSRVRIFIAASKTVDCIMRPMIRKASITDDTFEKYHASVEDSKYNRTEANILGAKNLLPLTNTGGTGNIWTVMNNGTVVANGTPSSSFATFPIVVPSGLSGNFLFSGCPEGGKSGSTVYYDIYPWDATTGARPKKWDGTTTCDSDFGGTSQEIQIPSGHTISINCRLYNTFTANNLVFKPMLRLATDTDDTFEPYAMTNKELTDALGAKADISSLAEVATSNDYEDLDNLPDLDSFYSTDDTAGTTLDDADNFPFYDDSATAKKNITWNYLKSLMKSGISTTSVAANSTDLITSGGVYNALPHTIGTVATVSAGQSVRIPASGTDDRITTNVSYIYIPVADTNNGKRVKISNMSVYSGYLTITVAQALSAQYIGVLIVNTI